MKKVVVILSGIMVLASSAIAGCTPKATTTTTPPTQNITGTVTSINTPSQPGPDSITITTPTGQTQTFTVTDNTDISYQNTACPIEEAGRLITAGNATYNCTIVYDETYHAIAAGFWKQVGP